MYIKGTLRKVLLSLLLFLAGVSVAASELSLGGLILDRSVSRFGKDFSFYFSSYWREIPNTDGVTLVIHEQVYPQAGTVLWIEMDQQRIFQTTFGRRHNDVKQVAEQAILICIQKLAQKQAETLFGENDDSLTPYLMSEGSQ